MKPVYTGFHDGFVEVQGSLRRPRPGQDVRFAARGQAPHRFVGRADEIP